MLETTVLSSAVSVDVDQADRALYVESFLHRWDGLTRTSYRDDLRMFFAWCDDNRIDVFSAHRTHLERYMRHLAEERGNKPATICHRISTLRQFYEIALDDDLVRKNPCRLLRLPKVRVDQERKISLDSLDFDRLIHTAAAGTPSEYALIMIMGICGLRVSEACSLDIETSLLLAKAHRMFRFVQKGGETALVPQPPVVMQAVDRAIGERTSGPLLLRRDGSRMTRRSADRVVKRLAQKAGIEQTVSPHVLRHTAAMTAFTAKVPMEIISRSLRHKEIGTTYKFYNRGVLLTNEHASHIVAGQIHTPTFA